MCDRLEAFKAVRGANSIDSAAIEAIQDTFWLSILLVTPHFY
jgi:hypothetical protein